MIKRISRREFTSSVALAAGASCCFEQSRLGTEGAEFGGRRCPAWSPDLQLSRPAFGRSHHSHGRSWCQQL